MTRHSTPPTPVDFSLKADLRLDFIIIGASIAGLSCAYALRQAGHNVRVFELQDGIAKGGAGLRLPPNMTKILWQWGLGSELEKISIGRCPKIAFQSGSTGEVVGELIFHKELMKAIEADAYLIHYADLIEMLYRLAVRAGAEVTFGARVLHVDSSAPSVTLENGTRFFADIVVGADGDCSIVRPLLQGHDYDREGAITSYVLSIPRATINGDAELEELIEDPSCNVWMGDNWAIMTYPVCAGSELAVNIFREEEETQAKKGWTDTVPVSGLHVTDLHIQPRLKRLLGCADKAIRTRHIIQAPLDSWYDDDGHIVVVGEAAHLLNPGSNHGHSLAVEDAAVLGRLFTHLHSRDQITQILAAFQELRENRCRAVRDSELEKTTFSILPPGPQRDARDEFMRKARNSGKLDWSDSPETYLRKQWEELGEVFGYNAYEEADTWWVEWGILHQRLKGKESTLFIPSQVVVQVSVE